MNEPIINPWIFYLVGNLENFKLFFSDLIFYGGWLIFLYLFSCFIRSLAYEKIIFSKAVFISLVVIQVLLSGIKSAIPDKETAYTMLVASMVTPHNIQVAGEAADNVITYTGDKADAFATRLSEIITDSAVKVIEKVKE